MIGATSKNETLEQHSVSAGNEVNKDAMPAVATPDQTVELNLLIHKKTNQVLFARAGKDFVDILFSFLTLPLGAIARLIERDCSMGKMQLGCLSTLYTSVKDLRQNCLVTTKTKEMIIPSQEETKAYYDALDLYIHDSALQKYFLCSKLQNRTCPRFLNPDAKYSCFGCGGSMCHEVEAKHVEKESVIADCVFMITDDLTVFPHTRHFSTYEWLEKRGIRDRSALVTQAVKVNAEKVFMFYKPTLNFPQNPISFNYNMG